MCSAHSTPLERKNVPISFSINIAHRWRAAFSRVSTHIRNSSIINFLLKTQRETDRNCPNYRWLISWVCVKFLAKYGQKTCPSDLRIATCRESEFPRTKNCAVNAKYFTHPYHGYNLLLMCNPHIISDVCHW